MKALWKAFFAALNPSPIFEAVAGFAENLATRPPRTNPKQLGNMKENKTCRSSQR
jgi:hypothetical protein